MDDSDSRANKDLRISKQYSPSPLSPLHFIDERNDNRQKNIHTTMPLVKRICCWITIPICCSFHPPFRVEDNVFVSVASHIGVHGTDHRKGSAARVEAGKGG